jgi:hypothetical protein
VTPRAVDCETKPIFFQADRQRFIRYDDRVDSISQALNHMRSSALWSFKRLGAARKAAQIAGANGPRPGSVIAPLSLEANSRQRRINRCFARSIACSERQFSLLRRSGCSEAGILDRFG